MTIRLAAIAAAHLGSLADHPARIDVVRGTGIVAYLANRGSI